MKRNLIQIKCFIFIVALGLLYDSSHASFLFSSGEAFTVNSTTYDTFDIVSTDGAGHYAQVLASLSSVLPPEANIVALQYFSASSVIFSLNEDAVIQGTPFNNKSLLFWNGSTVTLLWDGQANGLPPQTNLDAVNIISMNPLQFSFSLGEDAMLTVNSVVTLVRNSDLVHFTQGSGFTGKDFDATAQNIPYETNLDAFAEITTTQWIMAFDADAIIPTNSANLFHRSDLLSFNPTGAGFSASPYFSGSSNGLPPEVGIDAVSLLPTVIPMTTPPPIAGFYGSPTTGIGPFIVNFFDTSANVPTTWAWTFGDGGTDTTQNPSHQYNAVGSPTYYNVQLVVSNSSGMSTAIQPNYIYVSTPSVGLTPSLSYAPSLKSFIGFGLNTVFNLEDYNNGGTGTSYSIPVNFLSLGTLNGSYISESTYNSATVGTNSYSIINTAGSSTANGLIKYSTYRIQKLPIVGLTPGSSWDVNMENYTYDSAGLVIPPSYPNSESLNISDPSSIDAYWTNASTVHIISLKSFTGAVTVDVTASPIVPAGMDQDKERIYIYSNLLSNSTFSTANDTTIWGPAELAPGRTVMASSQWISSYTDSAGTQATGVWQFIFADANGGVKSTPKTSDWINITDGQWYTFRMRLVADITNNSHQSFLYGYTNIPGSGTQTDIAANILFGVPTVWTWQETPLLAHGTGTTGYPQFQLKAGGAGSIYVDEIQIINAAPTLVSANRSNTQFHYLYGQFTAASDTTGWGQQVYTGLSNVPTISVANGLVLNFAGASSSSQEGIKWTANNNVQGSGHAYTFPATLNHQVGIRLTLHKKVGNFNSLGILLLAVFGVQSSGQQDIGTPPSNLIASADIGVLLNGSYRAVGEAVNPYYQGQFGVRSDLSGTLLVNDVDMDIDNDDPNFGDPTLFP